MARMPGAIWRPITVNKSRWRLVPLRVNLHVAVSEAASLHGYFNAGGRPDSHFYVRRDGTIEQYVDTALVAYADLEGNGSTISVETQGGVTATQTEPWTAAQVEAMARIYAWAVRTHGIARRIADDSRPGTSSRGLSWHRLGCDGNFPGRPLHGRVPGGRKYSNAFGKVCPGTAKIRQIPTVYDRAVAILDGGTTTTPGRDWFTMASEQDLRRIVSEHAENVHAAVQRDLRTLLPGIVDEVVRKRVALQNTALHNAFKREITAAVGAVPGVDVDALSARLSAALVDDIRDTLAAMDGTGLTPDQYAQAAADELARRLTEGN